jgi:hypothetical protein
MPIEDCKCGGVCVSRYSYLQRSLTEQWLCFAAELHGLEDGSVEATFEVPGTCCAVARHGNVVTRRCPVAACVHYRSYT